MGALLLPGRWLGLLLSAYSRVQPSNIDLRLWRMSGCDAFSHCETRIRCELPSSNLTIGTNYLLKVITACADKLLLTTSLGGRPLMSSGAFIYTSDNWNYRTQNWSDDHFVSGSVRSPNTLQGRPLNDINTIRVGPLLRSNASSRKLAGLSGRVRRTASYQTELAPNR